MNAPRRLAQLFGRHTRRPVRRTTLRLEQLEDRTTPSADYATPTFVTHSLAAPNGDGLQPDAGSTVPYGLSPAQVRHAYGVDAISFGGIVGDGSGQIIGIIDAYDNPGFVSSTSPYFAYSDLHKFDVTMGLPDPVFHKVGQTGSEGSLPSASAVGGWSVEEALDVEWAHAMAPAATIILIECTSESFANLVTAGVATAKSLGCTVISMSFGTNGEFSGETGYDSAFTGTGVSFVASTGDRGAPGGYPAWSPNVIAVGGTGLSLGGGSTYGGEYGWSGSGGGLSLYESRPTYQDGVQGVVGTHRGIPDISFLADPNTGVAILSSYDFGSSTPWLYGYEGGTSLAAPCIAGLISIVNQGRALNNLGTLSGSSILSSIYSVSSANYHDITSGSNGYSAVTGYDLVTGVGTPVANKWVVALSGYTPPTSSTYVAAAIAGSGVWRYNDSPGGGWVQLATTDAYSVRADSLGDVCAVFAGGIYVYDHSSGSWGSVNAPVPYSYDFVTKNSGSGYWLVGSFGTGVWRLSSGGGWAQLAPSIANLVAVDKIGNVAADYYYEGLYLYTNSNSAWARIGGFATSVDIANGIVAGSFNNSGVYRYSGGGWSQLTPTAATQVAVDDSGDVVADFYYSGVYFFSNSTSSWKNLSGYAYGVDISGGGAVLCNLGGGLLRYTSGGWRLLTASHGNTVSIG
jgi:subtilase family serine protease